MPPVLHSPFSSRPIIIYLRCTNNSPGCEGRSAMKADTSDTAIRCQESWDKGRGTNGKGAQKVCQNSGSRSSYKTI
ncbi:hypothetical protein BDR03DRAFT_580183 [Suillus americanus]|nr:hypothetical protein BDR03DRAFT_580183 [Suillus americanus]